MQQQSWMLHNKLVITSMTQISTVVKESQETLRSDLHTSHKEIDVVMACLPAIICIKVMCNDNDVIALLCYFQKTSIRCTGLMEGILSTKKVVDIISGCESVASGELGRWVWCIPLKKGCGLSALGNKEVSLDITAKGAMNFITRLYGDP